MPNRSQYRYLVAIFIVLIPSTYVIGQDPSLRASGIYSWSPDRPSDDTQPSLRMPSDFDELEVNQYQNPELQTPTTASFNFYDIQISEVLEAFQLETGIIARLGSPKLKGQKVDLRLKSVSPTKALEEIASHIGAYVQRDGEQFVLFANEEPEKTPEYQKLEYQINDAFPNSTVKLSPIGKRIVVKGQAKDFIEARQILDLVQGFMSDFYDSTPTEKNEQNQSVDLSVINGSPFGALPNLPSGLGGSQSENRDFVINLLTVPGAQQVMLRVTVARVNRTAARSIGLNFLVRNGEDNLFRSALTPVADSDFLGSALSGGTIQALIDSGDVGLAIEALRDLQLAKTIAEPNLTAMHGEEANFNAGGQFPVPVVSGLNNGGNQGVQFVPFGVSLDFIPFIIGRDRIRLVVSAEVSARNESIGSSIGGAPDMGGTAVSGLDSNQFSTTVEMKPGQTLAVAGLIQNSLSGSARRIPGIEDIPILGRLAAQDLVSSTETELVILVTPEFVKPVNQFEKPPLPGEDIFEPNDLEFFVNGQLESQFNEDFRSAVRTDSFRRHAYYQCERNIIVGSSGFSSICPAASSPQGMATRAPIVNGY